MLIETGLNNATFLWLCKILTFTIYLDEMGKDIDSAWINKWMN